MAGTQVCSVGIPVGQWMGWAMCALQGWGGAWVGRGWEHPPSVLLWIYLFKGLSFLSLPTGALCAKTSFSSWP